MASKMKFRDRPALTPEQMHGRINKALQEGRSQQALELARTLFKQDASPAHLELVKTATLARARQLRSNGYSRDAATVLINAIDLGGADFLKQVAEELAGLGEVKRAGDLLQQINDPEVSRRVLNRAVDAAMRQGPAGGQLLPPDLRGQFDLVRQAFSLAEAGKDEAARAALQGIGLQSPFLEWKLFLRGLLAYYHNDDARALENWQRLDSQRLPARLASPFRFHIDPAFQKALPPEVLNQLQKVADQLQGSTAAMSLRGLQGALVDERQLPQAFRNAEVLLPTLQQQAPQMVPRLAACFYWAIIEHGNPEDLNRYRRVFGSPHDDPNFARLEALATEHTGDMELAHIRWQEFERWLADNPAWGPEELRRRARALIWERMGENAGRVEGEDSLLPAFLRRLAPKPPKLKPGPEQCFRQSLDLAPDQLAGHQALVRHYQEKKQFTKAIQAARKLLKCFPDHVATLELLGDLYQDKADFAEALQAYQQALRVNPLESRLRSKVETVHLSYARSLTQAGLFDQARGQYQAVLAMEQGDRATVLIKWAGCEFKAGDQARGEELIAQARQEGGQPILLAYYLLSDAIRNKLTSLKARFAGEFEQALNDTPTTAAAGKVVELAASLRKARIIYHGQKTHEKKVLAYLDRAFSLPWTENQLEAVCDSLFDLKATKPARKFIRRGQQDFAASPIFFIKEAELMLAGRGRTPWIIESLLQKAQHKAEALPHSHRRQDILKTITELRKLSVPSMPKDFPPGFPMEIFEMMGDMFGDDEDFDEGEDGF